MTELGKLGRYQLRRVLGRGAMGVVYEGFDPNLNRRVAVKTILKSVALDEETERAYSARFVREAQAVGRLNHPHIVQVHDFGEENEVAYLVMEFIQGRELRSFLDAKERFEPRETVRVMCELLEALDFAHEAGVIHRDVKPANVMLDTKGRVKLADFGVARLQDTASATMEGTMVGTPAFMSPEQVKGERVDGRTDIFSSGTILYLLLTGEAPFKGEGAWTLARKIVQDDPPSPSSLVTNISAAYDEVIRKAMAKDPAQRYQKAREFAAALRDVITEHGRVPGVTADVPTKTVLPADVAPKASDTELEFWRAIQNSNDPKEFEFYLTRFPNGVYAQLARYKIEKLGPAVVANEGEKRARREVETNAKREVNVWAAQERARAEATAAARGEAEARALRVLEERAEKERARADADVRAKREAEKRARQMAESKAQAEAEARMRAETKRLTEDARHTREGADAAAMPAVHVSAQPRANRVTAILVAIVLAVAAGVIVLFGRQTADDQATTAGAARVAAEGRAREVREKRAVAEALARAEAEKRSRLEAETKRKETEAKHEAELAAKARAGDEARKAAEEKAKALALKKEEESREKVAAAAKKEAEASVQAEAEARRKAEEQDKRKAEANALAAVEARRKADELAKREAEEKARALASRKEEEERRKAEVIAKREAEVKAPAQVAAQTASAPNAGVRSWVYQAYRVGGWPSAPGYVALEDKDGKTVLRMMAGQMDTCFQGDLEATVIRTESTTTITAIRDLRGCTAIRLVIKNDGTGGQRQIKKGGNWVWDGLERVLTPRK